MIRKVIIVNDGARGWMSSAKGDYDRFVGDLKVRIEALRDRSVPSNPRPYAEVEVTPSTESVRQKLQTTDVLIFVTLGKRDEAEAIQKQFPRLKVIVFTGLLPDREVILLPKACANYDDLLRNDLL